jgi:hypothetical protein
MDPILAEVYSTVLTAAPYVIAAYALMWAVLLVYVIYSSRSIKSTERQLIALEEAVRQLKREA